VNDHISRDPDAIRGCQGLSELLTLAFRPVKKEPVAPKRPYRVGWWKPVSEGYAQFAHSYKRFEDYEEALAFATEKAANVEVWTNGKWRTEYRRK